ncbi:hypothetical protein [uncultured Olleya sp.]|uniref:hypothetical protein n=1 Tax=uncultured Olleya sp. TaxID=757243 RepID=UPI00259853A9|nr:hypothetical protein [uncultured Olleya sp.]
MGLQEQRAAKAIEDQYLSAYQNDINTLIGQDTPITIHWDTFELDYIKFVPSVCLQRLTDALKGVCQDYLGKTAVQNQIKNIHVFCIANEGAEAKKELKLDAGVLSLTACWGGHHSGFFPDITIQNYLENKL